MCSKGVEFIEAKLSIRRNTMVEISQRKSLHRTLWGSEWRLLVGRKSVWNGQKESWQGKRQRIIWISYLKIKINYLKTKSSYYCVWYWVPWPATWNDATKKNLNIFSRWRVEIIIIDKSIVNAAFAFHLSLSNESGRRASTPFKCSPKEKNKEKKKKIDEKE